MKKMNVVIYGATGNIGRSVLSIIRKNKKFFNVEGVTCNTNVSKLIKIADSLKIKKIGFNEKSLKRSVRLNLTKFEIFNDISDYEKMITKKTDIIVFANSGLSSLELLFKLLKLVSDPFKYQESNFNYYKPPNVLDKNFKTYCGT